MIGSRFQLKKGEEVWKLLKSEGGFVWSHKDGTKTIHFNQGMKPSKELVLKIKTFRAELRMFIDAYHHNEERQRLQTSEAAAPHLGSSLTPKKEPLTNGGRKNLLTNEKGG